MIHVAGAGLAGTLVALELERQGKDFTVWDLESGARSSRVAAGIFNPLLGPRFTPPDFDWDLLYPHYVELEKRLGAQFFHPANILRPFPVHPTKEFAPPPSPYEGSGWIGHWKLVELPDKFFFEGRIQSRNHAAVFEIQGGGWLDIPRLLDAARARWLETGNLREERLTREGAQGKTVIWCGGIADFTGEVEPLWKDEPWQAVKGEVLTVEIPDLEFDDLWIGPRFLLPLGNGLFRFGATHEHDELSFEPTEVGRKTLEADLAALVGRPFRIVAHLAGVRPCSRKLQPLVQSHKGDPRWILFNGFAGRGVSRIPASLADLFAIIP